MTGAVLVAATPLAGEMEERAVQFAVNGQTLRGNLVAGPPAELGVLFLHGWSGVRGGPHNLLTRMARELAGHGVPSLRFDFRGRGESDGDGAAMTLADMAADAIAAAELLRTRGRCRRLVLAGICSGGNVAIGALDRLDDVAGLFMISVYPFGDADNFGRAAKRTAHFAAAYWRKLRDPRTWRRLARGEIDFGGIGRVLFGHFRRNRRQDSAAEQQGRGSPLDNLLRNRPPMTMIYGTADPDWQASHDYYRDFDARREYGIDFVTIAGANHNFYAEAWTLELGRRLRDWLAALPPDRSRS